MKTKRILVVIAVMVAACGVTALTASDALSSTKRPKRAEAFESSPGYDKLDLRLRDAWRGNPGGKDVLECILKARGRMSEDDQAALAAAGFNARTVISTIATGNLKVRDVPDVANLPFIQVMELAVPMSLKNRNP